MSRDNTELLRKGLEAVNRRDAELIVSLSDPDVEFHAYFSQVLGGSFRGHSGMRAYLREIAETFEEFVVEINRTEDRGDLVLAQVTAHGRGVSGVDVEWHAFVVARLRNGRVWRMATDPSEQKALEAVGLQE